MGSPAAPVVPIARKVLAALVTILQHDVLLDDKMLKTLSIYTNRTDNYPSWLPTAERDPRLDPRCPPQDQASLQPPEQSMLGNAIRSQTGYEWAGHFCDTAQALAHPISDIDGLPLEAGSLRDPAFFSSFARPRDIDWSNPFERMITKGELKPPDNEDLRWRMMVLLQADSPDGGEAIGCIAADNSYEPLPKDAYGRGELLCHLALIGRELKKNPANPQIASTVIMFTSDTARASQMYINREDPEYPTIHLVTRFELRLDDIFSDDGYGKWLQATSWVCFRLAEVSLQAEPKYQQQLQPHRHRTSGSETISEGLGSVFSECSHDAQATDSASASSRRSCSTGSHDS